MLASLAEESRYNRAMTHLSMSGSGVGAHVKMMGQVNRRFVAIAPEITLAAEVMSYASEVHSSRQITLNISDCIRHDMGYPPALNKTRKFHACFPFF